jgi:hypothetical protein
MAWRAAATVLSFAALLLSVARSIVSFARSPVRVLGAAMIAGILTVAAIGAFNLSVAVALVAADIIAP